jgi:hypothetical protein
MVSSIWQTFQQIQRHLIPHFVQQPTAMPAGSFLLDIFSHPAALGNAAGD